MERKQWFIDRIGKRVYRNRTSCGCETCKQVLDVGLMIHDMEHAIYLCDVEYSYNAEGSKLKYFDTKEEVLKFENE